MKRYGRKPIKSDYYDNPDRILIGVDITTHLDMFEVYYSEMSGGLDWKEDKNWFDNMLSDIEYRIARNISKKLGHSPIEESHDVDDNFIVYSLTFWGDRKNSEDIRVLDKFRNQADDTWSDNGRIHLDVYDSEVYAGNVNSFLDEWGERDLRFGVMAEALVNSITLEISYPDDLGMVGSSRHIKSSRKITSSYDEEGWKAHGTNSSLNVGTRVYLKKQEYKPGAKFVAISDKVGTVINVISEDEYEVKFDSGKKKIMKEDELNIWSSRKITSARYIATDPESGEVLGSADTYEEAVNEWGEEVTITDSEKSKDKEETEGGLFQSKKPIKSAKIPTGDRAFMNRIVSSLLSQEMTEEQAVKRVALRNSCNEGLARNILNKAMEDTSYISSGVMAIADDINQDFNVDGDIYSWYKDYVPGEGKANTVGGELVRAANQIIERYGTDGDRIGIGYGRETCNPAARYIIEVAKDYDGKGKIQGLLDGDDVDYDEFINDFEDSFTDYLRDHEELFHSINKDDMLDYKQDDDRNTSINDCFIKADGVEYWFNRDGTDDDWHCDSYKFSEKPEMEVDDTFDDNDDFANNIDDRTDEYVDFTVDGFNYSVEAYDEADENDEHHEWVVTEVEPENLMWHDGDYVDVDELLAHDVYDTNGRIVDERDIR